MKEGGVIEGHLMEKGLLLLMQKVQLAPPPLHCTPGSDGPESSLHPSGKQIKFLCINNELSLHSI